MTTTVPGQNALLNFQGTAGQRASLRITSSTIAGGNVSILQPNGSGLGSTTITANSFLAAVTLPVTGTYTVNVNPSADKTGQVTFTLYVFDDVTGSLTINGAAVPVTITTPGQNGVLTFAVTAGQAVTVRVTGNTMGNVELSLLKPDGTSILSTWSSAASFNLPQQTLATAGTYKAKVNPSGTNTGSLNLSVTSP